MQFCRPAVLCVFRRCFQPPHTVPGSVRLGGISGLDFNLTTCGRVMPLERRQVRSGVVSEACTERSDHDLDNLDGQTDHDPGIVCVKPCEIADGYIDEEI